MIVKGYCASVCHGLTFLGSIANMGIGVALIGVGAHLATDFLGRTFGLRLPGLIMIGVGCYVALNGVSAMVGGCKVTKRMISMTAWMSCIQILLVLIAVIIMMTSVQKEEKIRLEWKDLKEDARSKIENKLQCCGFDDIEDGVPGCKFKQSCNTFIPPQYKKRAKTGTMVLAAALFAGALATFSGGCLNRKLGKQVARHNKKDKRTLVQEAQGIDPSHYVRPPRSERTKKAKFNPNAANQA